MKNILGAQMRAARALLRWAAADLVRELRVSLATIHRANRSTENSDDVCQRVCHLQGP